MCASYSIKYYKESSRNAVLRIIFYPVATNPQGLTPGASVYRGDEQPDRSVHTFAANLRAGFVADTQGITRSPSVVFDISSIPLPRTSLCHRQSPPHFRSSPGCSHSDVPPPATVPPPLHYTRQTKKEKEKNPSISAVSFCLCVCVFVCVCV
ncbi:hypothetical protein T492DRAFT_953910, partial [Pavlovales sp. CCMP2436]